MKTRYSNDPLSKVEAKAIAIEGLSIRRVFTHDIIHTLMAPINEQAVFPVEELDFSEYANNYGNYYQIIGPEPYNQVIATNLKASEVYISLRHYLYHEINSQHAIRQAIEEIASQKED